MKVLIFGGIGYLGRLLTKELISSGYGVSVITRNQQSSAKMVQSNVELIEWDEPKVLINGSAVGYYGPRQDEEITESKSSGQDFLAEVYRKWVAEAYSVRNKYTRVATIRIR